MCTYTDIQLGSTRVRMMVWNLSCREEVIPAMTTMGQVQAANMVPKMLAPNVMLGPNTRGSAQVCWTENELAVQQSSWPSLHPRGTGSCVEMGLLVRVWQMGPWGLLRSWGSHLVHGPVQSCWSERKMINPVSASIYANSTPWWLRMFIASHAFRTL